MTVDQVFVAQLCNHFPPPQEHNLPTMHLTALHFKTNMPKGAQMGTSAFAI